MAVDSALTGMIERKQFQNAPGTPGTPAAQPGDFCRVCCSSLIRLEGKLSCGRCGWPADREVPARLPQTIGIHSQNADLLRQKQEMEAELAALKVENAALKAAQPAREEQPPEDHQPSKRAKR